jgi:hypothetical protein
MSRKKRDDPELEGMETEGTVTEENTEPVGPGSGYKGTNKTAQELADLYGLNPDGSPRTEPAPDGPACPPLAPGDGPFNTTVIYPGCSVPLSQECADWANAKYGFEVVTRKDEPGEQPASEPL